MGIIESGCRPVTVERLSAKVSSSVRVFEPNRRYAMDLKGQPETASVLCAIQTMYLGVYPKDMSTYFNSGTPNHRLAAPREFAGFAGIFAAETRMALLGYFQSDRPGIDLIGSFEPACPEEIGGAMAIVERNGDVFLRPALISREEEHKWRAALTGLAGAVDAYFSYRGRPMTGLPETKVFLDSTLPFLFSAESISAARTLLTAG